jgi:hypothetical protein
MTLDVVKMTRHVVKVRDVACEITIYQKSKSVWIAVGEYMGEPIEEKGSSANSAAAHWRNTAQYKSH